MAIQAIYYDGEGLVVRRSEETFDETPHQQQDSSKQRQRS